MKVTLSWRQFDEHSKCLGFLGEAKSTGGSQYRFLFSVTLLQTQRATLQQLNDV